MYEADGPDLGYTLNTHHENLQMAYHYWRGTHLGDILLEEENRFGKWLAVQPPARARPALLGGQPQH